MPAKKIQDFFAELKDRNNCASAQADSADYNF